MPGPPTGASLGQAVAGHIARAYVATRQQMQPVEQAARQAGTTAHLESWETELAPLVSSIVDALTEHAGDPLGLKAALTEAQNPQHQIGFIIQALTTLSALLALTFRAGEPLVQSAVNELWTIHPSQNVPASLAGTLAARGHLHPDTAYQDIRFQGFTDAKTAAFMDAGYEGMPWAELLDAVNRGALSPGDLDDWLKRSGLHPFLWDVVKRLAIRHADPASAVQAVVESQLSPDAARAILHSHGVDPADFDWLVATAGEPPGVFDLGELVNRGLMSLPDWQQAIRESRIKNKYVDVVSELRFKIPPERSVVAMMRAGGIDKATGAEWLHQLGFRPDAVTALVGEATNDKIAADRELSAGMVAEGYELRLLTYADAHSQLVTLGYDDAEATFVLAVHDHKRELTVRNQAVGAIRAHYVGHKIDRPTASRDLDALGVPAGERDDLVHAWDLEVQSNVRLLTEAQLAALHKAGIITSTEYRDRLVQLGYTVGDADLLLALRGG